MSERDDKPRGANEGFENLLDGVTLMLDGIKKDGRDTLNTPALDKYVEARKIQAGSPPPEARTPKNSS